MAQSGQPDESRRAGVVREGERWDATRRLQRLLGMPEDGGGIPFGSFRPADIPAVIMELVPQRLRELDRLSRDGALSPQAQMFLAGHKFHTYEDFCLQKKHGQPGKKDHIGYGASLERGDADLPAYLQHIRERDGDFGEFLDRQQPAAIPRDAFDTSVYITGETNSGKSYLAETLAFLEVPHIIGQRALAGDD